MVPLSLYYTSYSLNTVTVFDLNACKTAKISSKVVLKIHHEGKENRKTEIKNDSPLAEAVTQILLTRGSDGLDGASEEDQTGGCVHRESGDAELCV